MTPDFVGQIAKEAIEVILFISLPFLGVALIVGLIISIFQAATQIQEASLLIVPKIVVFLLTLLLLSPWVMQKMIGYTEDLLANLPRYVH
ncbi:MAG: flagellar biosynthesis protein FliQ [Thermodesulfobacteriota bacterium]